MNDLAKTLETLVQAKKWERILKLLRSDASQFKETELVEVLDAALEGGHEELIGFVCSRISSQGINAAFRKLVSEEAINWGGIAYLCSLEGDRIESAELTKIAQFIFNKILKDANPQSVQYECNLRLFSSLCSKKDKNKLNEFVLSFFFHEAALQGHLELIQILTAQISSFSQFDWDKALYYATEKKHWPVVAFLCRGEPGKLPNETLIANAESAANRQSIDLKSLVLPVRQTALNPIEEKIENLPKGEAPPLDTREEEPDELPLGTKATTIIPPSQIMRRENPQHQTPKPLQVSSSELRLFESNVYLLHRFNQIISVIKNKKEFEGTLAVREKAQKRAQDLYRNLQELGYQYFGGLQTPETYLEFRQNCFKEINDARVVLEVQPGWKQILVYVLAILFTGGLYGVAALIDKALTGRFTFFETEQATRFRKFETKFQEELDSHYLSQP